MNFFNYKTDITLTIKGNEWSIKCLLDMNDQQFQDLYEIYQEEIYKLINENNSNPAAKLGVIGISTTIGIMERVVLERRIQKLEQRK